MTTVGIYNFLIITLLFFVVSCSAISYDHLLKITGSKPIPVSSKDLFPYVAQGYTTTLNSTCLVKLYNTPAKTAAGQRDLTKLQRVFIKKFNSEYGGVKTTTTTSSSTSTSNSSPQILAYDTEAVDQLVGITESPGRRLIVWTWIQLTVKGKYVCRLCPADNSDLRQLGTTTATTTTNTTNSVMKKKNTKGIAQKILNGLIDRDYYSGVTCVKVSCDGSLEDVSQGCAGYIS